MAPPRHRNLDRDAERTLARAASAWRRQSDLERTYREARDDAIRAAAAAGAGPREIARATGLDFARVHRIINR